MLVLLDDECAPPHILTMRHWFKTPVSIWVDSGTKQVVTSVEEAARMLLDDELWPTTDTLSARKAVLAAMEGGSIDDAAAALVQVARAAGILAD